MTKIILAAVCGIVAVVFFIVFAFSIGTGNPDLSQIAVQHNEAKFVCETLPFAEIASQMMTQANLGPHAQSHIWYVSVILAQWGIEQGWSLPTVNGFNFGNVAGLPGEITRIPESGTGVPMSFTYSPSPQDGINVYVRVAQNGLYNTVGDAYPNGAMAQAKALGESPWDAAHYTDDSDPGSSLIHAMSMYNLEQFDRVPATATTAC